MNFQFLFSLLSTVLIVNGQIAPEVPSEQLKSKEFEEPYKDQNQCAFLSPRGNVLPYSFWTCGIPFKQPYCGSDMIIKYECCPGFKRNKELLAGKCGESESTWELIDKHISDYVNPKLSKLLKDNADLPELFNKNGTNVYTLFIPYSDSALKQGSFDLTSTSGSPHPIRMHIVKDRFYSSEMNNGALIETTFNKHKLKVTTYSNGLVFIDCRALTNPDHEAKNGIIHYISGPITPHVGAGFQRKTVLQALQNDPETNAFYTSIPSNLRDLLDRENEKNWFTVMAPTNSAWNNAVSKYGDKVSNMVKNHILNKMICAQAITRKATSLGPTLEGEYLGVNCNSPKSRSFINACGEEANIIKEDLVAGNGVVQVIDSVLVPSSAMNIKDAVKCAKGGETKFSLTNINDMVESCSPSLDSSSKYIVLAPINKGFDWLNENDKFKSQFDGTSSCNVLKYHILKVNEMSGDQPSLSNQMMHKTLSSDLPVVSYNVQYRYGPRLFFNHARAVKMEPKKFDKGFIYFVDRVLTPPTKTIMQLLSERTDVSTTHQKLKESGHASELSSMGPKVLFMAPQNHGWKTRDEVNYGSSRMKSLMELQTIKLQLWGGDIGYLLRETITNVDAVYMDGGKPLELQIKRKLNGNTYIGYEGLDPDLWSKVIESNLHATDGMLWIVDWPLRFKN